MPSGAPHAYSGGTGVDMDPLNIGQRLAELGTIGILGVAVVTLAWALALLYRKREKDYDELKRLFSETAAALAENAEARREVSSILVELKDSQLKVAASLATSQKVCEETRKIWATMFGGRAKGVETPN